MSTYSIIAVVHGEPGETIGVSFPQLADPVLIVRKQFDDECKDALKQCLKAYFSQEPQPVVKEFDRQTIDDPDDDLIGYLACDVTLDGDSVAIELGEVKPPARYV